MANPLRGEVEEDTCSQTKTKKNSSSIELVSEEQLEQYTPQQQQPTLQNEGDPNSLVTDEFITGDELCGDGQNGRDAKSRIPAGPDILPGDDHCLKALRGFLFEANDQNTTEATKYLSRIGWKLDEDNVCYTSPENIKYDSLSEACKYLTQGSPSSHSESQALVLLDPEVGIEPPESYPQAVADWYYSASADKRKCPRDLSSKVKEYLLTTGWKLRYIPKKTKNKAKRELRYISPKERTYTSLVRACKEIMEHTAGSTSQQPSAASHGMQSQVHNQGQSQIKLQNQSQAREQLLSQNVQNTIVNAGVRSSTSLPPALPSVTSLTQTSMPNSTGQRINMQSGFAQNFVGSSVSQGVQQPQKPQYLHHHQQQLRHQISKQKLQGNIQSSVMPSHIQQQPLQQPQNLFQPTQMSNAVGQSTNMQSEIAQNSVSYSVSQGVPSNIVSNSQHLYQQPHQILSSSIDSEADTEQNAVDWQEEIYQKIQVMKEKYFADLNDMYHIVSIKCEQHDDSDLNVPESELIEELKTWKIKLESIIHSFYVSKKKIVPGMMEKYLADLNDIYHKVSIKCEQHDDSVLNVPESEQSEELKSWKILLKHMIRSFYSVQK